MMFACLVFVTMRARNIHQTLYRVHCVYVIYTAIYLLSPSSSITGSHLQQTRSHTISSRWEKISVGPLCALKCTRERERGRRTAAKQHTPKCFLRQKKKKKKLWEKLHDSLCMFCHVKKGNMPGKVDRNLRRPLLDPPKQSAVFCVGCVTHFKTEIPLNSL